MTAATMLWYVIAVHILTSGTHAGMLIKGQSAHLPAVVSMDATMPALALHAAVTHASTVSAHLCRANEMTNR